MLTWGRKKFSSTAWERAGRQERPKIPPEEGKKKSSVRLNPFREVRIPQQNFVYVGQMEPKREKHKTKKQSPDGVFFLWEHASHKVLLNSTFLRLLFVIPFLSADRNFDPNLARSWIKFKMAVPVRHASVCSTISASAPHPILPIHFQYHLRCHIHRHWSFGGFLEHSQGHTTGD